jgi:hypothetical protein
MEKHEDLTQTANKEESASVDYSEIKPPENETDKIDGDLAKIDRPTVHGAEIRALIPYKESWENGDNKPEPIDNSSVTILRGGQGDTDGRNQNQTLIQAPGRNTRKGPMDFFNEFKEAYCLGEPDFFHTPDRKPFMSLNVKGRYENIMIYSQYFAELCHYFSIKINKTPACSNQCIKRLQTILSTMAIFEGPEKPVHVR